MLPQTYIIIFHPWLSASPPSEFKYDFQHHSSFGLNSNERFPCGVCGKSYLRKRHLQRHMRDECIGIPPRFSCDLCPSRFRRKYHMVRHLTSKHGIPPAIAQQANGGSNSSMHQRASEGARSADGGSVGSGCDSPLPENLCMKKEHYENENNAPSPLYKSAGYVSPTPMMPIPTYGLTGAITAISAAAAVVEEQAQAQKAADDAVRELAEGTVAAAAAAPLTEAVAGVIIKPEPITPTKSMNNMNEDWKMKLSLQLISNSLLKERLMNSMPFAYNNN